MHGISFQALMLVMKGFGELYGTDEGEVTPPEFSSGKEANLWMLRHKNFKKKK